LIGQFIGEDSRSITVPECAKFIEVRAVANDLFLAKRASRLVLSNVGKGIYSIRRKSRRFGRKQPISGTLCVRQSLWRGVDADEEHLRRRG
jgi:hypothetical protein